MPSICSRYEGRRSRDRQCRALSDITCSSVAVRAPPTVDAANRIALSFLIVALPDDPVVFKATASVNVLSTSFNVIVPLLALVVKVEVVPTANSEP